MLTVPLAGRFRQSVLAVLVVAANACSQDSADGTTAGYPAADPDVFPAGCWSLAYGPATPGLPAIESPHLLPTIVRIWMDSTFPDSPGFPRIEAAPGYPRPGGATLAWSADSPDSLDITWTGPESSTHYQLGIWPDSMAGTAWRHTAEQVGGNEPRRVTATPVECRS